MTLSRARAVAARTMPASGPTSHEPGRSGHGGPGAAGGPAGRRPDRARRGRVVSLLADDTRITMPPRLAVWEGRREAARFLAEVAFRLVRRPGSSSHPGEPAARAGRLHP